MSRHGKHEKRRKRKPSQGAKQGREISPEFAELLVVLEVARRLVELTGMTDVGEVLEAAVAAPDFAEAGGGEVLDATVLLLADLWRLQSAVRQELTWPV